MFTPLEQFKIFPYFRIKYNMGILNIDLTITNSTIFMLISLIILIIILSSIILNNNNMLIKNSFFQIVEFSYLKIQDIILDIIGPNFSRYLPFIFSLFFFIFLNNSIGLLPYCFTTTSHIIVTLTFSLTIIIGSTLIGIIKHNIIGFLSLFVPKGLNNGKIKFLIPLIFIIEIISYFFRIISLSVRLSANLLSGHTLLKIIANFGLKFTLFKPYFLLLLPLFFVCGILILEFAVAIIQAYVFTLLTTIYIKDAELLH